MDASEFKAQWDAIAARAQALHQIAAHHHLVGNWEQPEAIKVHLAPPASERRIGTVEAWIGRPIPRTLRQLFAEGAAAIDIRWLLPARAYTDADGLFNVDYELVPPPPFQEESRWGTRVRLEPKISGGGLSISLATLARLQVHRLEWRDQFVLRQKEAETAGDQRTATHFRDYVAFWDRCFAIAATVSGDIVGIDRASPAEELILLNHEGVDEPGFYLGQDLLTHLDQQSRLGFVGFALEDLILFDDKERAAQLKSARLTEALREDMRSAGIEPPGAVVIDADGPNGRIWRDWFGAGFL